MNKIVRMKTSPTQRWLIIDRLMHHTMHCMGQQALDLTEIYKLALASFLFMKKSREQRSAAIETGNSITKSNMQHGRWLVLTALQMGQPCRLLNGRTIGTKFSPGPCTAKGGHGHHHQLRINLSENRIIQFKFRQYSARVVFNHGVCFSH